MTIFVLTRQKEVLEYISQFLMQSGHNVSIFTDLEEFFFKMENSSSNIDLLMCDYRALGFLENSPYAAMKARNKVIPFLFYNDPFPSIDERSIYWYSKMKLECGDNITNATYTRIMPLLKEIQDILKREDIYSLIDLLAPPKDFSQNIIDFDCEDFKRRHNIQESKYDLFLYFYTHNNIMLSIEDICTDLWIYSGCVYYIRMLSIALCFSLPIGEKNEVGHYI